MYVFRGEKLADKEYIKAKRKEDIEALNQELSMYEEFIREAKKNININFDTSLLDKMELTKEEEKQMIDEWCRLNSGRPPVYNDIVELQLDLRLIIPQVKIEYCSEAIKALLSEENKKTLIIALDKKNINKENIDEIIEYVRKSKKAGLKVLMGIDSSMFTEKKDEKVNYVYSKEEIELLLKLDEELKANDYPGLRITEITRIYNKESLENAWSLDKVLSANEKIDIPVQHIIKNNLSPFEAMLYIHSWASGFEYNRDILSSGERSRVLPHILNDKYIVCSGYATLIKAIIEKVNMPGLKCEFQGCSIIRDKKSTGHCHNLVHIEDPKYDIKGTYVEDACWDSKRKGEPQGFAHCLYPVEDVMHYNNMKYREVESEYRYSNVIGNYENFVREKEKNIISKLKYKIEDTFGIPKLYKKYRNFSKPIDLKKYEEGLMVVYGTFSDNKEAVEELIKRDVTKSMNVALNTFNKSSRNTFIKEFIKNKNSKEKNKQSSSKK